MNRRRSHHRHGPWFRPAAGLFLAVPAVALLAAGLGLPVRAQEGGGEAPHRFGRITRITLPIDGDTLGEVQRFARTVLDRARREKTRPILIFEFEVPPGQAEHAASSPYGASRDVADFLSGEELSGATVVAYLPDTVRGHAVLAVLACDEIVMAAKAELGPASTGNRPPSPDILSGYREIADRRKTVPAEVALGLVDASREVLTVETDVSREYVSSDQLDELAARRTIQSKEVLFPRDQPGRLTGKEASEHDFVSFTADDRRTVARLLGLAPESLREMPTPGGGWRAVRVDLKGPLTPDVTARAERTIENVRKKANFICLWIDSPGGSPNDSTALAAYVAGLDSRDIWTVAYIPKQALADAALVAMACNEVIVQPDAVLGGEGAAVFSDRELDSARETLRDVITEETGRSWSLPVALVDPELEVFRYTRRDDPGWQEYFSEEELGQQPAPEEWKKGPAVTTSGEPLQVSGEEAVEFRLAHATVADFGEFKARYGLEDDPALVEPGWVDTLLEALASPVLAGILLMLGMSAAWAEFHTPGLGVGGFVAMLCFTLFFWSQFLGHTAEWLEVMLFVVGVVFLLIELFVLPGFGIFGLGGGLLILASIILASQSSVVPRNSYQFAELQRSLSIVAGASMGTVALAMVLNRWLPKAPGISKLMLEPAEGDEAEDRRRRESLAHFEDLVGQRGTVTNQLSPAGKALFGDRLVDVIADGELVRRGSEVEVVEVHGNQVLVRPVE